VLTAAHVLQRQKHGQQILVDRRLASIEDRGALRTKDGFQDDGCDWALLHVDAFSNDPPLELARAEVDGHYWYWGYNGRRELTVVNVGDNVASFLGCYVKAGESGSGVFDDENHLVGIITSGVEPCTSDHCPVPKQTGWFCMVSPEITAAIDKARGK
jgi:V8-like Glu-specific endopeptidase